MKKSAFLASFFIVVIALIPVVNSCTTVPLTGRSQVTKLISDEQVMNMSTAAYQQVLDSVPLSTNQEQVAMIKRVGTRIQNAVEKYMADNGYASQLEGFEWEFNLIDNDTLVNAWAMPGGKVAFYTGILPICEDELGVAVVMGHEVAHAVAKHGQERMNQAYIKGGLLAIGAAALGQDPTTSQRLVFQAVGLGADLKILSFSRKHESEADELGLTFMAMAGYDPREAPKFWERMSGGSKGNQPPEFMSTHPSHETRIQRLNAAMPEALKYYNGEK